LRRRRWVIVITTICLLAATIIFVLIATPRYTATATVFIDPRRSSVADTNSQTQASKATTDDAAISSQVNLIQSVAVVQKAVDDLNLVHDPEFGPHASILGSIMKWITPRKPPVSGQSAEAVAKAATLDFLLQRRLKVTRQQTTYLVDINVVSESPEKAARIANAIADSYFYEQVHSRYDTQKIAAAWFNEQIEKLKSEVLASDKAVEQFRASHNLTASQGVTINDQQLSDLTNKLIEAHVQTAQARAQFESFGGQGLAKALDIARSREEALQKSLDNLKRVSNDAGSDQVRLRELQREADANRTLYGSFLARYKETSAQESLNLPDSRVVSKADVPISPSFPKTTLLLALAFVGGIGFGCVLALAVDHFDRRVKSLRHAEEITGVPTLAAIPVIGPRELASRAIRGRRELKHYNPSTVRILPAAMQPPLMRYVLDEPTSLFAESVRSVRLAIQRASRTESTKTIMVSSSIDGEGKTTLAVNLAFSLAAVGMRTILLEGDLRNPEMSRSLCPRAEAGVVEVATGQARFDHALLVDRTTGLAVLPSPPRQKADRNCEFVFSEATSNILEQLRQHFDYVIIDAPPIIPLVDARALAEIADRVILTIRWDSTPQDVVAHALGALAPVYDRVLGAVLTRVDMDRLRFYDYYRSSSYLTPYSYLGQPRAGRAS
jgi:capsular exopolysaccharide synthesis family protein